MIGAVVVAVAIVAVVGIVAWYGVFAEGPGPKVVMQPATIPKPKPALKNFTVAELAPYTGSGGNPIYIGVNGVVFNMSSHEGGAAFYGPGGSYNCFAGRDATIGLGMMQVDPTQWKKKNVDELTLQERETMQDWFRRFQMKYDIIGALTDGANPTTIDQLREKGIAQ